ncbi:hypothetical protein E2C01_054461 [Portunus trituberculatus]|uniref:Uncharacterized protein n=1 Tax=Portunus trituberculatus TaxID=210409 RepID=A0A5B7GS12_PORTR|nr:hypothetical protein [Portunus trituberculatus]
MKHGMSHQYRPSGSDILGIAWNVPGEHRGNGNNKQQHYNAPQNVSLTLSNFHIEKLPCRSQKAGTKKDLKMTSRGPAGGSAGPLAAYVGSIKSGPSLATLLAWVALYPSEEQSRGQSPL